MEPLRNIILEVDVFAKGGDDDISPFHLQVSAPEFEEGRGYFCKVRCPYFREKPYMIFGADEEQACKLVTDFVARMLVGRATLVDKNGYALKVPLVIWRR